MNSKTTIAVLLVLVCSVTLYGQANRSKKVGKLPVIRETVTIKGNLPPKEPKETPINETDPDVWRKFTFSEHKLTLEFPSKEGDSFENEIPDLEGVWTYSADTERGTYRIMIRDVAALLDNREIAEVLDSSIAQAFSSRKGGLMKGMREVLYQGRPGREFIVEEKNKVQIGRVFVLNKKLFAMFVTVEPISRWSDTERWARKFLDSFTVDLPKTDQN